MDLLSPCETLIQNVIDVDFNEDKIDQSDVDRWRHLFGYSAVEATQQIRNWRGNLGRYTVSTEAWSDFKEVLEASGYSKEAYEYSIITPGLRRIRRLPDTRPFRSTLGRPPQPSNLNENQEDAFALYLVSVEGPIAKDDKIDDFGSFSSCPITQCSVGSEADISLVDGPCRFQIIRNLADLQSTFWPAFKQLSPHSRYPTIGTDTTLPQFRPQSFSPATTFLPTQDQYPVWYFFYGTLADQSVLSTLLGLPARQPPAYRAAQIRGGRLVTQAGNYKALIDAGPEAVVHGSAFLLKNADEETALRYYETEKHSVVRCEIRFEDNGNHESVMGLTFKFVG